MAFRDGGPAGNQQRLGYQQQYTSPPLTVQQIQQLQQLQQQQQHTLQMRASGGQQIRPGAPQRGTFLSNTPHNSTFFCVHTSDHTCICCWTSRQALCPPVPVTSSKTTESRSQALLGSRGPPVALDGWTTKGAHARAHAAGAAACPEGPAGRERAAPASWPSHAPAQRPARAGAPSQAEWSYHGWNTAAPAAEHAQHRCAPCAAHAAAGKSGKPSPAHTAISGPMFSPLRRIKAEPPSCHHCACECMFLRYCAL